MLRVEKFEARRRAEEEASRIRLMSGVGSEIGSEISGVECRRAAYGRADGTADAPTGQDAVGLAGGVKDAEETGKLEGPSPSGSWWWPVLQTVQLIVVNAALILLPAAVQVGR